MSNSKYQRSIKNAQSYVEENINLTDDEKKAIDMSQTNIKDMVDDMYRLYWHHIKHPQTESDRIDVDVFVKQNVFEFFLDGEGKFSCPWEENGRLPWVENENGDEYLYSKEEFVLDNLKNTYFKVANQVLEFEYLDTPDYEKFWKKVDYQKEALPKTLDEFSKLVLNSKEYSQLNPIDEEQKILEKLELAKECIVKPIIDEYFYKRLYSDKYQSIPFIITSYRDKEIYDLINKPLDEKVFTDSDLFKKQMEDDYSNLLALDLYTRISNDLTDDEIDTFKEFCAKASKVVSDFVCETTQNHVNKKPKELVM
ncbi:hypothetical protein [Taylorella equigenitalis]|uniref:hypothetical protein n=1 Tax=Taylorella equigenitalis TaxID=29575 RepID=UPI0003FD1E87|nr:hypothetical protein [Taylorella equigenitalis]ASY42534.1 hypothetical protein CA943_05395 [Taylorella equigenitalis]KGK34103.1 hypothetical protein LW90_00635 [Taylorella equigenitalis]WDU45960.1 hypothetical protein KNO33_05455 [Taylorella equigenitalis]WDU48953.1 hypothetical protein KNO34_05520 [Taylorella equigenitalis]WDU51427.1 hypothetical protein KNO32_05500 [Taylorella equigenitalis]